MNMSAGNLFPSRESLVLELRKAPHVRNGAGDLIPLERKDAALLAYLALAGPTQRAAIASLLWPGADEPLARTNLRQRLSRLRKRFDGLIEDRGGVLVLADAIKVGKPDKDQPFAGVLLANAEYADCPQFESWLQGQREQERQRCAAVAVKEVRDAMERNDLDAALHMAVNLVGNDGESEEAFRLLMEVYYLRGDVGQALNAYDRCREMLRSIFGVAPSSETAKLGRQIQKPIESSRPPSSPHVPVSVLRPPILIARDEEVERILTLCRNGTVTLVRGPSGVGKSRLLAEVDVRMPLLVVPCLPTDPAHSLTSARRWLASALGTGAVELDEDVRRQCNRLLSCGDELPPLLSGHERTHFEDSIARALLAIASHHGRVLAIEDVQFGDRDSWKVLAALVQAATQNAGNASCLLLTLRSDFVHEQDEVLNSAIRQGACQPVELLPLSARQTRQLLATLEIPRVTSDTVELLVEHCGGRPAMLLEAIKAAWHLDPREFDRKLQQHARRTLAESVALRVASLGEDARRLLWLAAMIGRSLDTELAIAVLGGDSVATEKAFVDVDAAGLGFRPGFAHDSIREAVLVSVDPKAVADLSARIADHLIAHNGDSLQISHHLLASARSIEAVPYLARAARQVVLSEHAASLLHRAASLLEDVGRRAEAFDHWFQLWRLARVTLQSEIWNSASLALHRCATTPGLAFVAQICTAEQLLGDAKDEAAMLVLELPLDLWRSQADAIDGRSVSRAMPLIASVFHRNGRSTVALPLLEDMAVRVDRDDALLAAEVEAALGSTALGAGLAPRSVRHFAAAVRLARQAGEPSTEFRARGTMIPAFLRCGRFDDAWECASEGARIGEMLNHETGNRYEAERGAISYYLGRFAEALHFLDLAKVFCDNRGIASFTSVELIQSGVYLDLGRPELALRALNAIEVEELFPALRFAYYLQLGVTRIAAGLGTDECWSGCDRWREQSLAIELLRYRLIRAEHLEPAEAVESALAVAEEAERLHHWHVVRSAHTTCANARLREGDAHEAVRHAQAAFAASTHTDLWTCGHVDNWWVTHRALRTVGRMPAATEALRQAVDWLRRTADRHVPPVFRESFLQRHPVHRAILQKARGMDDN